jgi:hypothetical protein
VKSSDSVKSGDTAKLSEYWNELEFRKLSEMENPSVDLSEDEISKPVDSEKL